MWVEFFVVFYRGFCNYDVDGFNCRFGGLVFLCQGVLIVFDIVLCYIDGEIGKVDIDK